jgi:glycosyltransferase involved in cell wall biosynthesis
MRDFPLRVFVSENEYHGINKFALKIAGAVSDKYALSAMSKDVFPVRNQCGELHNNSSDEKPVGICNFIQYSPTLWETNADAYSCVLAWKKSGILSKAVVTLHDVYVNEPPPIDWSTWVGALKSLKKRVSSIVKDRESYRIQRDTLTLILDNAKFVVLNSEGELSRLNEMFPSRDQLNVGVINHFLSSENRSYILEDEKRKFVTKYGCDPDMKIIGILGVVHHRKGYHFLPSLLAELGEGYQLLIGGEARKPKTLRYLERCLDEASRLGVRDRINITGFLDDDVYNKYIASVDVAVAPFLDVSASGTLADWISSEKVIVASENHISLDFQKHLGKHAVVIADFSSPLSAAKAVQVALANRNNTDRSDILSEFLKARSLASVAAEYHDLFEKSICRH